MSKTSLPHVSHRRAPRRQGGVRTSGPSLTVSQCPFDVKSEDWIGYSRYLVDLASGQRSDRPKRVVEVILEVAAGYAAVNITNADLASRIGCSIGMIESALADLRRLGIIYCVTDPRIPTRRHIVLVKHPETNRILDELAKCNRVINSNLDFEPWSAQEPELDPTVEPRGVIPYADGLGPLLQLRDLRRARSL
jgi:hypothetical protein